MYRLTAYGKTRQPMPGFPWRDLTDEEYRQAEIRYAERHVGAVGDEREREAAMQDARRAFREQGYFEHITKAELEAEEEAPTEEAPATRRRRSEAPTPPTEGE